MFSHDKYESRWSLFSKDFNAVMNSQIQNGLRHSARISWVQKDGQSTVRKP